MAGKTGQNTPHLTMPDDMPYPPLVRDMVVSPGPFAFPQAVDIAGRYLRSKGHDLSPDSFRYSVNPALSFPPSDIAALDFIMHDDAQPQITMMLNLMGLHGSGSPLPAYFTEYIAQHADEPDALRDFFDIFNHRLIVLLEIIWKKYRYYAQYQAHASDMFSHRFFGFIGVTSSTLREAKQLRWPRLMAYMGLIAFNGEASGSLESILRHYFSHRTINIIPCIRRWVAVPKDQQTFLDENNFSLGEDFILGDDVPDQTGKFRIQITDLTWEMFNAFLPSGKNYDVLQTLVKFVLHSRLDFDVELHLLPNEIRPWILDADSECRLGWSVWSGDGGDGIVILETDHQEL
ncbi:MAG: type VI secretion system baseplate subunit TssG [Desulfovibrio sp.]|jgi:type VI secretion system protein ImpH|nr:type VI secretion system baseplate subunit TssG [Desulfovibrio sp.]